MAGTERRPVDVEAVLRRSGRCLGCAAVLTGLRAGAHCCSSRCRKRVHRWRTAGTWPRARLLADAWGLKGKDFWRTDPAVFRMMDEHFHFTLDAASAGDDALCPRWLTPEDDGLATSWKAHADGGAVWWNPPYSRDGGGLVTWVEKAVRERTAGVASVGLVPPAPTTKYHQVLHRHAAEIRYPRARLAFRHPDTGRVRKGNREGSMFPILIPGHRGPAVTRYTDEPFSMAVECWLARTSRR